ncbi:MAG: class I SAM-dependent methyltransferase [Brevundimonas sp.]|uniref:class I SAM-dependent methyltransferase n=1 Tax=Brevundimonas sp. TaxID=1871086 RepID=UPI0027223229|nr:class I SAM-dependent methyltransferase [Brevundimonas sp.]MDO9077646.1 class I SAM-dependent methyltransferase [Brevundimonas sp.]
MHAKTPPAPRRAHGHAHGHMWLIGVAGMAAGLLLMVYVPSMTAISQSLLLLAGFHVVGGLVLLASLYVVGLRDFLRHLTGADRRAARATRLNFGWGPGWMNGLAIAALASAAAAVAANVAFPPAWPAAAARWMASVVFMAGNTIMRGAGRVDHVVLPMVDLLSGEEDLVLDAGCGAGRTTIALGRALRSGRVVGLDRFDANYIADGGRALLDRNLEIAGLADRVTVEVGDVTSMPFDDGRFDAAVSAHVYDHLGGRESAALAETLRVLKPGGRFLMIVWVPGWAMFAVANVFSLFLTGKADWRKKARAAGFETLDEGMFNNAWFILLAKSKAM